MNAPVLPMLPSATDPHHGVRAFHHYRGDIVDQCDVVVVGSGPGGGVAAKELAEAGLDVVLLEEGPPFGRNDFAAEVGESMQRTLREGGTRAARGNVITPTMQAIALGGGSIVNSAICARPPQWVFDKWHQRTGVELSLSDLTPHFLRVEQQLGVAPTPEAVQGTRNLLFKKGCDALGIDSQPTWRNVRGCRGSGECFTGCRNGAKRSIDVSYVPAAIRAGARVYTSVRAEQVVAEGRRVNGIRGRVVAPFTLAEHGHVTIHAKHVVLAAGCMATPLILLRSGLANRSGYVGRDLRFHPGLAIMAMFDTPVEPWKGATQGYHSLHHLKKGLKFEVLWAPPAVLAMRLPGLGKSFQQHLLHYDHMVPFDVICAGDHSSGTVKPKLGSWNPDIRFHLHHSDVARMQEGMGILADICWAAGATQILPGLNGIPEVLHSRSEANIIRTYPLRASDTIASCNHAFCTTRMSASANDGVVDSWGRCHQFDNLYIADTGIFAASSGVNPMLLCMALADRVAQGVAQRA